ncbi:MAG: serine/threonine protein kinase [Prevotella sp.]|nr:serine/threonine protein kinase [Prevotella sp.]
METSQFTNSQSIYESVEQLVSSGATCDAFRVKLYGKLHFLKRLKPEFSGDIRYREALRKEFETGYRLEHPNLVRYISFENDCSTILMEYIDGETLTQRLSTNPNYFKNRSHTDRFIRQLLDVMSYLHSHQVLHLDLKPDNIMLTRIGDQVKLIDLGFCYTDTFPDTTGHTATFAAPEQISNLKSQLSIQADIYTIGKILELLPNHHIYNKVIARCTAANPEDRFSSVEEIRKSIFVRRHTYAILIMAASLVIAACVAFFFYQQSHVTPTPSAPEQPTSLKSQSSARPKDACAARNLNSQSPNLNSQSPKALPPQPKDSRATMKKELEKQMDTAYKATIFTFCDSIFPSPITGKLWAKQSTEFHNRSVTIGDQLVNDFPDIPETVIRNETEAIFQQLTSYVFNKMRKNGERQQQQTDIEE